MDRHREIALSWAQALEVIPRTLASNCGLPAFETLAELRRQQALRNWWHGIDCRSATTSEAVPVRDMADQVCEPIQLVESVLRLSTHAVCTIVQIDRIATTD